MARKKYEAWKKALWEAWRAFLPAFLLVIYIQFEAGVDLRKWEVWLPSLLAAAVVAGTKAVFKWIRAEYFAGKYESMIYKIPA